MTGITARLNCMIARLLVFAVAAAILAAIVASGIGLLLAVAAVGLVCGSVVKLVEYVTERRKNPR